MAAAAGVPAPAITVPPAFKKLVTVLAGTFYAGQCPPAWWEEESDPNKKALDAEHAMFQQEKKAAQLQREAKRKAQQDTTGLGIILLTALTEEQWIEEDEFARKLNLPAKMVRKAMRYLEQEQVVQREHRKESVRMRKHERDLMVKAGLRQGPGGAAAAAAGATAAAAAAAGGGPAAAAAGAAAAGGDAEEEEAIVSKGHVITYCCLDYPRIVDSVRWRLATIKKDLQKEIKADHTEQRYKCPQKQCGKEYTSMDMWQLVSPAAARDGKATPRCTICGTEIVMVLDEGGKALGSMEDKKRRQRQARSMLETMDSALAPLMQQLAVVDSVNPPDFNSYTVWLHNSAALKQRLDALEADKAKAGGSKKRPAEPVYTRDTQIVVNITGGSDSTDAAAAASAAAAAAAGGLPGGRAAAAAGGGAGARPGAGITPPFLLSRPQQQQQPQAAKPIPPWLASVRKAATEVAGLLPHHHQQQQQQPSFAGGYGSLPGLKPEGSSGLLLGVDNPAAGVKQEGVKAEPAGPGKQEEEQDEEEWEDAAGAAPATIAGGAAAGSNSLGALLAEAAADADEEWEDV